MAYHENEDDLDETEVNFQQLRVTQQKALDLEQEIPAEEPPETTEKRLELWCDKWCPTEEHISNEVETFRRVRQLFGARTDDDILVEPSLSDKFYSVMTHYGKLLAHLATKQLADPASPDPLIKGRWGKMLKISECIFHGVATLVNVGKVRLITNTRSHALIPDHLLAVRYMAPDVGDINKFQQLLLFYLSRTREMAYRKKGTTCFKPRLTDTGVYTHSFVTVCEIDDFVYSAIFPKEHYMEQWKWFSDKPGNAKAASAFLEKVWDSDFPFLNRNKHILAFRNGLYFVDREMFIPFGDPSITNDMVASNYFNVDFEDERYEQILKTCTCCNKKAPPLEPDVASAGEEEKVEMDEAKEECKCEDNPMKLPTPTIDSIFIHQGLEEDAMMWIYGMVGRLFFDVGALDNWQILLFVVGVAATGKSSFLRIIEYLFDPSEVGIFNNNVEPNYPLQGIVDKQIFLAFDIYEGFRLDQYVAQSMISGEPISVAQKFKQPKMVTWKSSGVFAGNGIMKWNNNGDSVARRFMIVPFKRQVKKGDPRLLEKMKSEVAVFLKKCVMAYHSLVERHGTTPIWSALPEVFRETRRGLQKQTHPLESFITSTKVKTGYGLELPWSVFEKAYQDFCAQQKILPPRLEEEFYGNVFQSYGLTIEENAARTYGTSGEIWEERFLCGVDLSENLKRIQRTVHIPIVQ